MGFVICDLEFYIQALCQEGMLIMETIVNADLAATIRNECGENVFLCYQCQKWSSGCPVVEHFDLAPNQVMRAVQLGQKEMVLQAKKRAAEGLQ